MSGHKRTTISVDVEQYRRMHEAAQKASHQDVENAKVVQSLREETVRMLDQAVQQSRYQEEEFLQVVNTLQANVQRMESENHALVTHQADEIETCLQQMQVGMEADIVRVLEDQEKVLLSYLSQEQAQRRDWELKVEETFLQQQDRENRKYGIACDWVDAAWTLGEFIDADLQWQRFDASRFQSLMEELQTANNNLENEFIDAALLQAQQTYRALSSFRIEMKHDLLKRQGLQAAALQQMQELQLRLESMRQVQAIDQKGKELDIPIDVNCWTNGALDHLESRITQIVKMLEAPLEDMNFSSLETLLNSEIPQIAAQMDETVFQARLAVLQSQMRINIADIMLRALNQQGYVLQESEYDEEDQRQGFNARVLNLEGSQIVIEIKPPAEPSGSQEVHIHSLDAAQKTHRELRQRSLEISRSLKLYGLNVGALTTQPETPHPFQKKMIRPGRKERLWQNS